MRILLCFLIFCGLALSQDCGQFTTCSSCVFQNTECGWCVPTAKCMSGNDQGPDGDNTCGNRFGEGGPVVQARPDLWVYGGVSREMSSIKSFPVNPKHFDVYLYPGSPLDLFVTVTNPDQDSLPLDLYIIEDLSGSMQDDVATFQKLTPALVADVLSYQSRPRFGIGSFIEKPVGPFGHRYDPKRSQFTWEGSNNAQAENALAPCPTRSTDSGPVNWGFCHEMDLSEDFNLLQTTVNNLVTRENADWPENSLEALMFSAVCDLKWREGARKVVMIVTDASYHERYAPENADEAWYAANRTFARPQNYDCKMDIGLDFTNSAAAAGLNPEDRQFDFRVPGGGEDYPTAEKVGELLAQANIFPLIAAARALPEHDDLSTWEQLVKGWGFGVVKELRQDSSDFVEVIRNALTDLSSTMVMEKVLDTYSQVKTWEPSKYDNVESGGTREYKISLIDDQGGVEINQIVFSVVGYGEVTINVTNQIECVGCDGIPNSPAFLDLCGVCKGTNKCLGCDGKPFSGAKYDDCGVCNGNGQSCIDCFNQLFGTATRDICGDCNGNNETCKGCDGVPNSNLTYDNCSVCGGNDECRGCDGVINSSLVVDECGICGGNNETCFAVAFKPDPAPTVLAGVTLLIIAAVIAAVIVVLLVLRAGKTKLDAYLYANNQQMSSVGLNPLYHNAGGFQNNALH